MGIERLVFRRKKRIVLAGSPLRNSGLEVGQNLSDNLVGADG
jgi:hypothetical protein